MSKDEAVNGKAVEGEVVEGGGVADAKSLATRQRSASKIMRPIVPLQEAQEVWKSYLQLEDVILNKDDYLYFVTWSVRGKSNRVACASLEEAEQKQRKVSGRIERTKKKSAFRKMAVFFGLTLPKRGEGVDVEIKELENGLVKIEKGNGYAGTLYMDTDFSVIKAEFTIEVEAPNGRIVSGYGACSRNERGFTHHDHDIPATAWTRSLNRAISDMIGMGDVSAEEIQSGAGADEEHFVGDSPGERRNEASKPSEPRNVGEFLSRALKLVTLPEILEILELDDINELEREEYLDALDVLRAEAAE